LNRIIFLVDMNAFFIMCETTRQPELANKPAAVAGDPNKRTGIILTANYEARAFGVRTAMTLKEARDCCPSLQTVPPDHDFYERKSRDVMTLLSEYSPALEQNSVDEAWLDMTGSQWLFHSPVEAAAQIQNELRTKLGLWCSIGISDNKFLAKMASELKKPLGITTLWSDDVERSLWSLPVGSMYGVGHRTAEKLSGMGIRNIGDLAAVGEDFLVQCFGRVVHDLYQHARGVDDEPVTPRMCSDVKSVGRSITCSHDLTELDAIQKVLMQLADDVGQGARKLGRKGQTIQLTIKYNDFELMTRQMQIHPTNATQDLYEAACYLLKKHWNGSRPIRLAGISLSQFDGEDQVRQISLFDCGDHNQGIRKSSQIDETLDAIRARFGSGCVTFGKLLPYPDHDDDL